MPRQAEFTRAALDRRDDLVGDVLMDVEALLVGHGLFSSGLVAAAAATLPVGEIGVCKWQGENAERGIIGGDPPLRGGGRLCRESPILFLPRADGAGP